MKKIISLLALVVLCLSIAGCANKATIKPAENADQPQQDTQTQPEQDTQTQPQQAVETETEKFVKENKDAIADEIIANAAPTDEDLGISVTKDTIKIEAKGNAMTIKVGLLGLTEEYKQNAKDSVASNDFADEDKEYFNATFEAFKADVPTLESLELIYTDEADVTIFSITMNGSDVILK